MALSSNNKLRHDASTHMQKQCGEAFQSSFFWKKKVHGIQKCVIKEYDQLGSHVAVVWMIITICWKIWHDDNLLTKKNCLRSESIRSPPVSHRLLQKIATNNYNFGTFKRISIEGFWCEHHKTLWKAARHRGVSAVKISLTSFNPKGAESDFFGCPRAAAGPRTLNVNYRRTAAQIVIKIKTPALRPLVLAYRNFIKIRSLQRRQQRF